MVTGWLLRRQLRSVFWFALFFAPLLLLFGSIETYLLSWRIYRDPMGPSQFVYGHANQDGVRGAAANSIRYYVANISTGIDGVDCRSGFPAFLQEKCQALLAGVGLSDAGCRKDYSDSNMPFLKDGSDSGSDFGLVGCLALFVGSCAALRPSFKNPIWALSAAGLVLLVLTSLTVAWMPWNARFLCLSFILFGVSLATLVFAPSNDRFRLQLILGLIIIWSAISLPLHCGQRRPLDFWNALFARTDLSFKQNPEIRQVYEDVAKLHISNPGTWFLVAGENSWTLPFLARPGTNWQLTPRWDELLKTRKALTEPNDAFALILNTPLPKEIPFEIVKTYPSSTFIVRIPADVQSAP